MKVYGVDNASTARRIAAVAREILTAEGAPAVSMRRVAQAIGVTPMTIYRHYANREALLDQVAEDCFAAMAQTWTTAAGEAGDVEGPPARRARRLPRFRPRAAAALPVPLRRAPRQRPDVPGGLPGPPLADAQRRRRTAGRGHALGAVPRRRRVGDRDPVRGGHARVRRALPRRPDRAVRRRTSGRCAMRRRGGCSMGSRRNTLALAAGALARAAGFWFGTGLDAAGLADLAGPVAGAAASRRG